MRQVLSQFVLLASLLGPAVALAGPADDQYAVACAHYRRARWQLAVTEFTEFVRRYPQDSRARDAAFFLAEAHTQSGQFQPALEGYRRFLAAEGPSSYLSQARFRVGETLLMLNDLPAAGRELRAFHQQYPDDALNAYALVYLGQVALRSQQSDQAVEHLRTALKRYPNGPLADDCRLGLAQAELAKGKSDQAGESYRQLAAGGKHADIAQFNLAVMRYSQAKYAESAQAFAECLRRFPDSPLAARARIGKAWSHYQTRDWEPAAELFEQVAQDNTPEACEARYGLAMIAKINQKFAQAGEQFDLLVEEHPEHPLAETIAYHAADTSLRQKQHQSAIAKFDQLLARWPAGKWHDQALLGKLLASEAAERYEQAARTAEQILAQAGESAVTSDVLRAYGRVLVKQQRFAEAVQVLQPVAAESKTDPQLAYALALAWLGVGRYDESAEQLTMLLEADGTVASRAEALTALASLEIERRRFGQAAKYLEQFLAGDVAVDERHRARQQRLQCLLLADDLAQANAAWTAAQEDGLPAETAAPLALSLAEAEFADAEYATAETLFAWLRDHAPGELRDRGISGVAWCQFKLDEFEPCIANCDQLLALDDSSRIPEALLLKADALIRIGRHKAALASLLTLIDQHPKVPQAYLARWRAARLHAQLGQHDAAFALYTGLIERRPRLDNVDAQIPAVDELLYQAAWTRFDAGAPADGIALLQRIHDQHLQSSRWGDATYRLAEQAYHGGRLEQARTWLGSIIAIEDRPELIDLRHRAMELSALVAVAAQQWDQVERHLEQLLDAEPAPPLAARAKYWQAEAAWQQQDFAAAEQRFTALLADSPKPALQAKAELRRAQLHFQNKRYLEALDGAESLLDRRSPDVAADELHLLIGRCLAMRANFDAARTSYRRVVDLSAQRRTETAAMAQWLIGETYFHQQQFEPALREYLRVEILYAWPVWQATAVLQAGKCHEQLGQWQQAVDTYRRLLENWPQAAVAADASARLKAARQKLTAAPRTARGPQSAKTP